MAAVFPDVKRPSLCRDRAFNLLWGSQVLSGMGSAISGPAMPLLTLAITGSPIKAGLVGSSAASGFSPASWRPARC